ncbi:MAG: noncanonical pyrimidine nucleotidase, YjjG family [Flavobacteriales bacterium]|nr:noncanonical pyrimidine nucleotidase, YjjG family [Flavobacteriales bacterium]MBL6872958.1 noncanonical pyrimidine nucleotidase, YjjG family [Flavobacteriales bacterium]
MYKHLFFDLDRTLWDFEKNSNEVLSDLFFKYNLLGRGIISVDEFISKYKTNNEKLWDLYRQNKIEKEKLRDERFRVTLAEYNVFDDDLSTRFGLDYVELCPMKTHLFPFVHSTLTFLKSRYELHIITNGFEEVQFKKLKNNNLLEYFNQIITSEQVGFKKPNKEIFSYSFKKTFSRPSDCLMIGDDLFADIHASREVGMDQIYFNPNSIPHSDDNITYEIQCLSELEQIL